MTYEEKVAALQAMLSKAAPIGKITVNNDSSLRNATVLLERYKAIIRILWAE